MPLFDATEWLGKIPSDKPLAIILAGHNGSGKSTFWSERLSEVLKIPLINADRLALSILPEREGNPPRLRPWAASLRDNDKRWQRISQVTIQLLIDEAVEHRASFAYETVFSWLKKKPDGCYLSKGDLIHKFHKAGYAVVLLFVGLASPAMSVLRVETRREQGGHTVPEEKLHSRFPRTQIAIRMAAPLADLTLMFDNSRTPEKAFSLVRVQGKSTVHFDCRTSEPLDEELIKVAATWLSLVAPE